jgi:phosphoglycerate dehydrogenase-like enzyme
MLDDRTLSYLKPSAIVVNVGRGPLISTPALVKALDEGRIAGAALDVTDPEPLPDGHELYGRRNVIITPHLSGRTELYWDYAMDILEENLRRWTEGRDLVNVVDFKKGY